MLLPARDQARRRAVRTVPCQPPVSRTGALRSWVQDASGLTVRDPVSGAWEDTAMQACAAQCAEGELLRCSGDGVGRCIAVARRGAAGRDHFVRFTSSDRPSVVEVLSIREVTAGIFAVDVSMVTVEVGLRLAGISRRLLATPAYDVNVTVAGAPAAGVLELEQLVSSVESFAAGV
eukprot:1587863-Rhodomonas_salina.1